MLKKLSLAASAAAMAAALASARSRPAPTASRSAPSPATSPAAGGSSYSAFVQGHALQLLSPSNGVGEHYVGTISKFGVDIGYTSSAVIIWEVFAPNSGMKRGALTGGYGGATASATKAGVWRRRETCSSAASIARSHCKPLSISGSTGPSPSPPVSAR